MAWKVENGSQLRFGANAVMGCERDSLLPKKLIFNMKSIVNCTLNLLGKPVDSTIWKQGWINAQDIRVVGRGPPVEFLLEGS